MRTFLPVWPERVNRNPWKRLKCPVKRLPAADTVAAVDGLRERVKWILEHRKGEWNARSLSLAAGQSEGYVRKLTEREPKRPDVSALVEIARIARVSSEWLIFGRGAPEGTPVIATFEAVSPRLALIETLAKSVIDFARSGDLDGARASVEHLLKLLNADASPPSADAKPDAAKPVAKKTRAA